MQNKTDVAMVHIIWHASYLTHSQISAQTTSCSTVVVTVLGIMEVRVFSPIISPQNQPHISFSMVYHSKPFQKVVINFKIFLLTKFSTIIN